MEFSRSNIPAPFAERKASVKPVESVKTDNENSGSTDKTKKIAVDDDQLPLSFHPPAPEFKKTDLTLINAIKELIHDLIILNTQNGTYTKIKFKSKYVEKEADVEIAPSPPPREHVSKLKETQAPEIKTLNEDEGRSEPVDIPHEVMRRSFRNPNFYSRLFRADTPGETVENKSAGFNLVVENNYEDSNPDGEYKSEQ
ncbi:MAG: hypothetical protein GY863_01500 [bacterium]|nr:hypothetical protein [bacterium]